MTTTEQTPSPPATEGVELDRTEYVLRWADGPFAGLVIRMRKPTAAGHVDLGMTARRPNPTELPSTPEMADAVYRLFRAFAGALLEWNLLDRGEPVPATLEGLLGQEYDHAVEMTCAWLDHVGAAAGAAAEEEAALALPVEPLG